VQPNRTVFYSTITSQVLLPVIFGSAINYYTQTYTYSDLIAHLQIGFEFRLWWIAVFLMSVIVIAYELFHYVQKERFISHELRMLNQIAEKEKRLLISKLKTDYITGLSNEIQFAEDFIAHLNGSEKLTIILIDIVGMRRMNKRFGHINTDKLLKIFSDSVDATMRRNERMYKRSMHSPDEIGGRLYRKYPGGDEFYCIVGGTEVDALGFLCRLDEVVIPSVVNPKANDFLGMSVARDKIAFSFYGAVYELKAEDTIENVQQQLHEMLTIAQRKDSDRRIIWRSKNSSQNSDLKESEKFIYRKAEKLFSITKHSIEAVQPIP